MYIRYPVKKIACVLYIYSMYTCYYCTYMLGGTSPSSSQLYDISTFIIINYKRINNVGITHWTHVTTPTLHHVDATLRQQIPFIFSTMHKNTVTTFKMYLIQPVRVRVTWMLQWGTVPSPIFYNILPLLTHTCLIYEEGNVWFGEEWLYIVLVIAVITNIILIRTPSFLHIN